jgi:hypothetical protein
MAAKTKPKTDTPKNVPVQASVKDIVTALEDEQSKSDSMALVALMKRISGKMPKVWNVGTIGFDTYHYKYESGREGDCHVLGFYPRKGKFTIYLMDGTARHAALLEKLGKHTTSMACVYFKRLSDIQLPVLEKILQESYKYVKSLDGKMHRMEK